MKTAAHDVDVAKNSDDLRKMERLLAFGPRKRGIKGVSKAFSSVFLSAFSISERLQVCFCRGQRVEDDQRHKQEFDAIYEELDSMLAYENTSKPPIFTMEAT